MPERLHPGVYVEEVSSGVRPIEGVGTSTAAFVGVAARGIPGQATLLTSFADYSRAFGGHADGSAGYLAAAVESFFAAGGRRAYAVRVLPSDAARGSSSVARTRVTAANGEVAPEALVFRAKGTGKWSDSLRVTVRDGENFPAEAFTVDVHWVEGGLARLLESFPDVRMDSNHEDYVVEVIKNGSRYIEAVDKFATFAGTSGGVNGTTNAAAVAPTLNSKVPAATFTVANGAEIVFTWWDVGSEDEPKTRKVSFDAATISADDLVTKIANGNLTATKLQDGSVQVGLTLANGAVHGNWRLAVTENLKPGVDRVLRNLGFGSRSAGYNLNDARNPLTRPVAAAYTLTGGSDGASAVDVDDFKGDELDRTGLNALNGLQVNMVSLPGRNEVSYLSALVAYVDKRGDCMAIMDGPGAPNDNFSVSAQEAKAFVDALPFRSKNAAMFYPWVKMSDPVGVGRAPTRFVAPSGVVAGIFARTDNNRGVWKAPAGIDAVVTGALGLQYDLTDAEQDTLNPIGLNCFRAFPGTGIVLWGSRCLTADAEWRCIPVRRTALFLMESLKVGMKWAVFEPNDTELWGRIRTNIYSFMLTLFREGAFQGRAPEDAFLVACDRATNPQESVDAGVVTAKVAFAPLKPAEFVVIQVSQKALLS